MQMVINVDNELYEYFSKRRTMHDDGYFSHIGKLIKALRDGTILSKDINTLYVKGQKDMADAIRKAIDKRKEGLPKDDIKIGLMIAHNIINNVYKELVKADKEI